MRGTVKPFLPTRLCEALRALIIDAEKDLATESLHLMAHGMSKRKRRKHQEGYMFDEGYLAAMSHVCQLLKRYTRPPHGWDKR